MYYHGVWDQNKLYNLQNELYNHLNERSTT